MTFPGRRDPYREPAVKNTKMRDLRLEGTVYLSKKKSNAVLPPTKTILYRRRSVPRRHFFLK